MKKTKCVVCNSFMGLDIGLGHNPNGQEHRKTKDGKWACSEQCARDYNLALLQTGGNSGDFSSSSPKREIHFKKVEEKSAEQILAELEEKKYRDQKAQEEQAKRNQKAEELKSKGKPVLAFFASIKPTYITLTIGFAAMFSFIFPLLLIGIIPILLVIGYFVIKDVRKK